MSESKEVFEEVCSVLDIYSKMLDYMKRNNLPTKEFRFPGYDANNNNDHLRVVREILNKSDLARFNEIKELGSIDNWNTHYKLTSEMYTRMLEVIGNKAKIEDEVTFKELLKWHNMATR